MSSPSASSLNSNSQSKTKLGNLSNNNRNLRSFIQRPGKEPRIFNLDNKNSSSLSFKDINYDFIIANKHMIDGYVLKSRIPPYTPTLVSRFRAVENSTKKNVIIKYSPYTLSNTTPLSKLLNEWYILSGKNPKSLDCVDLASEFTAREPVTLPKDIEGIMYPLDFFYSEKSGCSGLVYDNKTDFVSLKEKFILNSFDSPNFLVEKTPSSSSLKSTSLHHNNDLAERTIPRTPSELLYILTVIIDVLKTLRKVHSYGVTNNGLTTSSLYVDNTGKVVIEGFDFAFSRPTENCLKGYRAINKELVNSLLPYTSPEATGKSNKLCDFRSDFYSIGIILYELCTGVLPFPSTDATDIIHAHLFQLPLIPLLVTSWIPSRLSDVIMKCLEKSATKRFSDCNEIINELVLVLEDMNSGARPADPEFPHKIEPRFIHPENCYNRTLDLDKLIQVYNECATGSHKIYILGQKGSGKTSILGDFKSYLESRDRVLYAEWSHEKFQDSDSCYRIFTVIIRQLLKQIIGFGRKDIKRWKHLLVKKIDHNLHALINIFPEIRHFIDIKQPPNSKESHFATETHLDALPAKFETRFKYVIKRFLWLFATYSNEGLTLLIDDSQFQHPSERWSFQEISNYVTSRSHHSSFTSGKSPYKLRVVSTILHGEPYKTLLTHTTEEMVLQSSEAKLLYLSPLNRESVLVCISEFLPSSSVANQEHIVDMIYDEFLHEKTPLALHHALMNLAMLKVFQIQDSKVVFNFQNASKNIFTNLTDYYANICKTKLDDKLISLLKYAACICPGNSFELKTLSIVSGEPLTDVYLALHKPLASGLISPLGIDYKIPFHILGSEEFPNLSQDKIDELAYTCTFEFAHDTFQDFILSELMGEDQRKIYHRECGLRLYERILDVEQLDYNRSILLARHFVESIEVAADDEYDIYTDVLISGGRILYDNYDFPLSLFYFQAAKKFFGCDVSQSKLEFKRKIDLTIVQLMFTLDAHEEVLKSVEKLVTIYDDPTHMILFKLTQIKSLFKLGRNLEAVGVALGCLRMLGIDIPEDPAWHKSHLDELRLRIPTSLTEIRSMASNLASVESADDLLVPEIISSILLPLSIMNLTAMVRTVLYIGVINGLDNGFVPSHGFILLLLAIEFLKEEGNLAFNKCIEYTNAALKIIEESDTPVDIGTAIYEIYCGTFAIYAEPFNAVSKYYDIFMSSKRAISGLYIDVFAFISIGLKNVINVMSGVENLNAILMRNNSLVLDSVLIYNSSLSNDNWNYLNIMSLKVLLGTVPLKQFTIDHLSFSTTLEKLECTYVHQVMSYYASFFSGEYDKALLLLYEDFPVLDYLFGVTCYQFPILYISCLLLLKFPKELDELGKEREEKFDTFMSRLETWASLCPENFQLKYSLMKLIKMSRSDEFTNIDVLDQFELVIEEAANTGRLLDQGLLCEYCAIWLLEISSSKLRASKLMKKAVRCFNLWGCLVRVDKLSKEYHELLNDYNWAGIGLVSADDSTVSPISSGAPFQWLLNNVFKNDHIHTSSDDDVDGANSDDKSSDLRRSSSEASSLEMKTALRTCVEISEAVDQDTILSKLVESTVKLMEGLYAVVAIKDRQGDLFVECSMSAQQIRKISHEPLDSKNDICPVTLMKDVFEKGNLINRETDVIYFDNKYSDADYYYQSITDQIPASAVCLPIRDHNEFTGVIYVEGSLLSLQASRKRVFTSEKIDVAVLFCTQLAFSLYKASLYEQMDLATNLAKAATEEKANFLNSMSHEIRTPFNSLLSCALFLLDTELTDIQKDYVDTIKNSSMVTLNIIDGILSFAKLENSSMTLENLPFSINGCVESALQLVSEQASTKNLELVHLNTSEADTIYGDITRFRQVIVNIVGNAVKFTSKGHVLVETKCRRVSFDNRYEFNVTVTDTGIGIPKNSNLKVFGAFSQVDGSARRAYGGAGLGLAISKKIVDIMGGSLNFESEEGKGTRFTFSLIVKTEAEPSTTDQLGKGSHVLVVDSHKLSRMALTKEISKCGFQVIEKGSLDNVHEILKDHKLEVVFINVDLVSEARLEERIWLKRGKNDNTKYVLSGPFGTTQREGFDRVLVLPFQRVRVIELLSNSQSAIRKLERRDSRNPLTKESISKLAETNPLKILLVEDNLINTKVTLQHLRKMGYTEADNATDGLVALEKCTQIIEKEGRNYDVVLMDIQMPNMDGIESCTRMMKSYKGGPYEPYVILLTANVVGDDRQRCMACGMSDFLSKPLLPNDLARMLLHASEVIHDRKGQV